MYAEGRHDPLPVSELLDLAESLVGRATGAEEVEVYVARGHDTEVRAYDGEVESLSSATSAGISNPRNTPAAAAATRNGPVHQEMPWTPLDEN